MGPQRSKSIKKIKYPLHPMSIGSIRLRERDLFRKEAPGYFSLGIMFLVIFAIYTNIFRLEIFSYLYFFFIFLFEEVSIFHRCVELVSVDFPRAIAREVRNAWAVSHVTSYVIALVYIASLSKKYFYYEYIKIVNKNANKFKNIDNQKFAIKIISSEISSKTFGFALRFFLCLCAFFYVKFHADHFCKFEESVFHYKTFIGELFAASIFMNLIVITSFIIFFVMIVVLVKFNTMKSSLKIDSYIRL